MSVKELRPLVAKSGHSKERRSELYFNDESCHTTHFVFCFVSRSEARGQHLPHAQTPPHRGAAGDLQLRRHALHGVRVVRFSFFLSATQFQLQIVRDYAAV